MSIVLFRSTSSQVLQTMWKSHKNKFSIKTARGPCGTTSGWFVSCCHRLFCKDFGEKQVDLAFGGMMRGEEGRKTQNCSSVRAPPHTYPAWRPLLTTLAHLLLRAFRILFLQFQMQGQNPNSNVSKFKIPKTHDPKPKSLSTCAFFKNLSFLHHVGVQRKSTFNVTDWCMVSICPQIEWTFKSFQ
jgi:hypothetical protein